MDATELAHDVLRTVRRPVVDDDPGIGTPRLFDEALRRAAAGSRPRSARA